MSHEAYEVLISAQLDGELTPEEEARLEEHLAACPQCRQTRAEMEQVHQLLLGAAAVPPPGLQKTILAGLESQPNRKALWGRRIAPFAAAAVVALVVLGVVKPELPFTGAGDQAAAQEYAVAAEEPATEGAEKAAEEEAATAEESDGLVEETEEAVESTEPPQQTTSVPSNRPQTPAVSPAPKPQPAPEEAKANAAQAQAEPTAAEDVPMEAAAEEPAAAATETAGADAATEEPADPSATQTEETAEPEEAEPATESAATGESEEETKEPVNQSSTLTWQQAKERLAAYLGGAPSDLTAQGMSADGERWLFTAGGSRYAVDMHTGAVIPLGSGQ